MKKIIILLLVSALLSGCYRITYNLGQYRGSTYKNRIWNNSYLLGIVPAPESRAYSNFCHNDRLVKFKSIHKPQNILTTALSAGMASSTTLDVTCAEE